MLRYKMGNYYELIIIMQFLKGFHFYILMYLYECYVVLGNIQRASFDYYQSESTSQVSRSAVADPPIDKAGKKRPTPLNPAQIEEINA